MTFRSMRVRTALLPFALATAALGSTGAHAVPNLSPGCSSAGVTITAYGATFQTNAQQNLTTGTGFIPTYNGVCGAGKATITYNNPLGAGAGSGKCITLFTAHAPAAGYGYTPYCGTDDALTATEYANANSNGGGVNHIPVAIGADAIPYNNPDCPGLVLDSKSLSDIFAGNVTTWGAVTDLKGTAVCPGSTRTITRVVRNAKSGTTWIFRTFLQKRNPDPWVLQNNVTDPEGPGGHVWPNNGTTSQQNGNSGIAAAVNATPGAIGYTDLATGINAGNTFAKVRNASDDASNVATPNTGQSAQGAGGAANCTGTSPLPPHTASAGWDQVSISDGATGYPICGFTYALIYTNNTVWGANVTAAQVRAAVDLLLVAISPAGQATLAAGHYAPLPQHAVTEAQAGLAAVLDALPV